jgi:hypothetical protein
LRTSFLWDPFGFPAFLLAFSFCVSKEKPKVRKAKSWLKTKGKTRKDQRTKGKEAANNYSWLEIPM